MMDIQQTTINFAGVSVAIYYGEGGLVPKHTMRFRKVTLVDSDDWSFVVSTSEVDNTIAKLVAQLIKDHASDNSIELPNTVDAFIV